MVLKKISYELLIILLISAAFVLTDWRFGIITFADLILFIIFFLLLIHYLKNKNLYFLKSQVLIFALIIVLVATNILFNLFFNNSFSYFEAIQGLIKVSFYLLTVIMVFNFIGKKNLAKKLLNSLSTTAVVVSVIGFYITISIYMGGVLPYEFFWEFTRQDLASYTYRGWDRSIIRTRSIFSEPAYLGFYLNAVLAFLYFNKVSYTVKKSHDFIITVTLILTLSYSAILIMVGIKFLYYFNWSSFISFVSRKRNIIFPILAVTLMVLLWDTIEKTIIIRTQEILSGADSSGTSRLIESWFYVNWEQPFLGNGIGNTPAIWNVYAYILSDLGLISFLLYLLFTGWLFYSNPKMAIIFIALSFQKGAYLGAGYWIFITLIIIYSFRNKYNNNISGNYVRKKTFVK